MFYQRLLFFSQTDDEPPVLSCPESFVSIDPSIALSTLVNATDNADPNPEIRFSMQEHLDIGEYDFDVYASDKAGNTATCSFTLLVTGIKLNIDYLVERMVLIPNVFLFN